MKKFDGILFDMDGTLWDAADSYCAVWNRTLEQLGMHVEPVTRAKLDKYIGMHLADICDRLVGKLADRDTFLRRLSANESEMMATLGGKLYPGVKSTLQELAKDHKLFMVSNCNADGLDNFFSYTGLGNLFTDGLSYGATGKLKDANIRYLAERYNLESPLYVGDVAQDCLDAHAAGVPFAWASYGFGENVEGADYTLRSFDDLLTVCKH